MKTQARIVMVAGTMIMISVLILALNSFQQAFGYRLQYLRQAAIELPACGVFNVEAEMKMETPSLKAGEPLI